MVFLAFTPQTVLAATSVTKIVWAGVGILFAAATATTIINKEIDRNSSLRHPARRKRTR